MSSNSVNENIVQLSPEKNRYAPIGQAIEDIRNGKPVVLVEDDGRESEGSLICSAEKATAQTMNLMMHARGMIRVAMLPERAAQLRLTQNNDDAAQTPFMVSIDAGSEHGVTTGLSANDKAITVQRLTAPNATALDFRRPGHMFPVTAKTGGVFRRVGTEEVAIDLTRLAGHMPMGVMCEILNEDGSMAQRDDLAAFAKKHGLSFINMTQLIKHRLQTERTVIRRVVKEIDTRFGTFTAVGYKDSMDGGEHLALVKGSIDNLRNSVPAVRVQHENLINDMFGKSEEMPHDMEEAMQFIRNQESGVVVYLRHAGDSARGLLGSLKTYRKQGEAEQGNGAPKEIREYGIEAQILSDLGVTEYRRIGKEIGKIVGLGGYGLEIVETISLSGNATYSAPPKVQLPSSYETETVSENFVSPVTVSDEAVTPKAQNENTLEVKTQDVTPQAEATAKTAPELKAEPRAGTMTMGGQVMKGQALFEGGN
jgi:3,4-dihydroxy 2-butanone 4-phosphate synthase/GTP cyclohydrolase II